MSEPTMQRYDPITGEPVKDDNASPVSKPYEVYKMEAAQRTIEAGRRIRTETTIPGGAYRMPDGTWTDANGEPLTDEQVAVHEATLADRGA